MKKIPRPLALIILDGWGYREDPEANAIAMAHKPHWNQLWADYPHTLISGSGRCVGLPDGQMGNSEVGHLNMGAGRVVHQDLTRIDLAIEDGDFFKNPVLLAAIEKAKKNNKAIHVMGLLSPGGVHSHERQMHALIKLLAEKAASPTYIHAILDGRDTPPKSARQSIESLITLCKKLKCGRIKSLIGRYFAMDRDKRWERVQKAYELFTDAKGEFQAADPFQGLELAYQRGETDEFVKPTVIEDGIKMNDGDVIIFMNYRADRARQLTRAFVDPAFDGFSRARTLKLGEFVSLTEYDATLKTAIAFPPERLKNILGEYLSEKGLKQLRIAETEKYAHVTFFFNGGVEKPFPGEKRILIPSPKVATYDMQPEMSAYELTEQLVDEIKSGEFDVIICNFANPDMIGHTGNLPATIEAIETIDICLGKILNALKEVGGEALITSDHGNAEYMFDKKTNQPHTAHTSELVPLVYFGRDAKVSKQNGILSDIAPTMLSLLGLPQPKEMTGQSIFALQSD